MKKFKTSNLLLLFSMLIFVGIVIFQFYYLQSLSEQLVQSQLVNSNKSFQLISYTLILLFGLMVLISTIFVLRQNNTNKAIQKFNQHIQLLAKGRIPEKVTLQHSQGLNRLNEGLNQLIERLKETTTFARKIGDGDFHNQIKLKSEEDELGISLQHLQASLQKSRRENMERDWANTGFKNFANLFKKNWSLDDLSKKVITRLVRYLKANQGALLIQKEDNDAQFLELIASYAYTGSKEEIKRIEIGESLVGQAFRDNETIYLTQIPDDYLVIESALGLSKPSALLIVPLRIQQQIIGVIEIASISHFAPFEIDFVEKLAENIAGTLYRIQAQENTRRLLVHSRNQSEELKAQEEEIRQHLEELQATHEEINRRSVQLEEQHKEIQEKNQHLLVQQEKTEKINIKLKASEKILRKAYEKGKAQAEMLQKNNEEIKLKNAQIEDIHSQISASIDAALTIQEAILPTYQEMDALFEKYFVIYFPRDKVSGDFYWINQVENKKFVVAADCTGHGVPGAFMSLIGSSLLDKIVNYDKIYDPAQILYKLHEGVFNLLKQEETANNSGMDLGICVLEAGAEKTKLTFAGAKRPLYCIKHRENELELMELKGTRRSIGGIQNEETSFTNQEIFLDKGNTIYLSSDGYVDQNNLKRRAFGSKRFKEILSKRGHLPLNQQEKLLVNAMRTHMQGTEQRDDILILAIQV